MRPGSIAPRLLVASFVATLTLGATPLPLVGGDLAPGAGLQNFKAVPSPTDGRLRAHALLELPQGWTRTNDAKLRLLGVSVLHHVYGPTYFVVVDATALNLKTVVQDIGVSLSTIPGPLKIAKSFDAWTLDPRAIDSGGRFLALVRFHVDVTPTQAKAAFSAVGANARRSRRCPCWEVALSNLERQRLAEQDAVSLIEPNDQSIRFLLHQARGAVDADAVQGYSWNEPAGAFAGRTGSGVTVGIIDQGGVPESHPAFWTMGSDGALTPASRVTANAGAAVSHTAQVAGIVAGSGGDSPQQYGGGWSLRGVAPRASLAVVLATNNEYQANRQAIVTDHASATNNSYGFSLYNAVSFAADNDAIVRGDGSYDADGDSLEESSVPARASVWAAGNNGVSAEKGQIEDCGYWSVLNPQKNGIVVGGSLVDPTTIPAKALERWDGSSIGPTLDGRLKPDLMAPACKKEVTGADEFLRTVAVPLGAYDKDSAYAAAQPCGTSYSAAFVTGVTSLLIEAWRGGYGALQPYPSTLKAVLIQGAVDISGDSAGPPSQQAANTSLVIHSTPGPDYATGYGEVSAAASLAVIDEKRLLEDEFQVEGDSATTTLTVPDGAARLRVTLAWDDKRPVDLDPFASKLVNDLDLELYGPLEASPEVRQPWFLPPLVATTRRNPAVAPGGLMAATTGTDTVNNVEQVQIDAPRAGTWEVRVKASKLPDQDGQRFSLASDFPLEPAVAQGTVKGAIVIPARFACRLPGSCPPCGRFGRCPPVRLDVGDMPDRWTVRLLNAKGEPLASAAGKSDQRARLIWKRDRDPAAVLALVPPRDGPVIAPPPMARIRVTASPAK